VTGRAVILAQLGELLGIDVRRVQPAPVHGKAGWRVTVAERRVPVVPGCSNCGYRYAPTVAIVRSGEVRNPKHLNRWTRSIGRPRALPPLTAEDGHRAVLLLHSLRDAA
jgi:hypothetical protein